MPTIRILPTSLINKIAAGEVIERPASVVKEMLENSIDSGASHIELTVEGGGMDLIRISDDGCGIAKDELLLAIAPHATSKLTEADDLFDIRTLGFRGEALASVAEISHLTLRSRTTDTESGGEISVRGGEAQGPFDCAAPLGTTIEVRNLFFNTPVRRKFLKSAQTEMGHTVDAFIRIAIASPMVHFTLQSNGRTVHELPATHRITDRVHTFFGHEVSDAMIPIDSSDGDIRLRGFVVDPAVSRSNNRMQYLFLNGRFIRDRSLQHALSEAYRGLLMVGRFPICFLHLDIPPNEVDVNVHPTKSEVRFLDGGEIYRRLLQTLRHKFLSTNLTAKVSTAEPHASGEISSLGSSSSAWNRVDQTSHLSGSTEFQGTNAFSFPSSVDARYRDSAFRGDGRATSLSPLHDQRLDQIAMRGFQHGVPEFRPYGSENGRGNPLTSSGSGHPVAIPSQLGEVRGDPENSQRIESHQFFSNNDVDNVHNSDSHRTHSAPRPIGFQIHDRYLVTEDERGMVVIDQHALHERILYEQIKQRVLSSTMESQRLLIPETVTLTATEAAVVLEAKEVLEQIGISVEPFGGDSILISAYPAMLTKTSPAEMVRTMIEPMLVAGRSPDPRDILDSMMNMMSCKAAIKAGDRLSNEEINALLQQRFAYQDTHHCPHGRPTALFFSREQLDKMFKRT